jgi:RimJ/RimL family protein N-acetyltransferase
MSAFVNDALPIRRLAGGERRPVLQVFEGLSERSRRRRFLGPKPRLREQELEQLVDVGCCGREAVVAVDPATGNAVGIARYVRTAAATAEVAFEVVDEWQGRGVGTMLVRQLLARAAENGISEFIALTLSENAAARALLKRMGFRTVDSSYGVVEMRREDSAALELVA